MNSFLSPSRFAGSPVSWLKFLILTSFRWWNEKCRGQLRDDRGQWSTSGEAQRSDSVPAVWHVHAHQRDALPVDRDERGDDPFADTLCPVYFFRHFLFKMIATQCLFSYFPAHMTM